MTMKAFQIVIWIFVLAFISCSAADSGRERDELRERSKEKQQDLDRQVKPRNN